MRCSHCKEGDKVIRIGIDVHKITCVATIRNSLGRKPEQTSPANNGHDMGRFATHAGKRYGCGRLKAVCKSAVNYRMRLHDSLRGTGSAPS